MQQIIAAMLILAWSILGLYTLSLHQEKLHLRDAELMRIERTLAVLQLDLSKVHPAHELPGGQRSDEVCGSEMIRWAS